MEYVGLYQQIRKNNTYSVILLIAFPVTLLVLTFAFLHILNGLDKDPVTLGEINGNFLLIGPFVLGASLLWFLIAYASHSSMIRSATSSYPLTRKENMRVYNLLENLCIAQGMTMPSLYVIDDSSLNAFASGIDQSTFAITLSKGIIEELNDEELEAVLGHELTHIRNRDVRLLIVSIVFVGIFAFISEVALRALARGGGRSRGKKNAGVALLVLAALAAIGWLLSLCFRFAISQKREFMADAGAAEMTKRPEALANALVKISKDPYIEAVQRDDIAQLFIEHPIQKKKKFLQSLFATHPPIEERIRILRQF